MRFKISLSIDLVNGEKSITMPRSPYLYTCSTVESTRTSKFRKFIFYNKSKPSGSHPSACSDMPIHVYLCKHVHVHVLAYVHEESDIHVLSFGYSPTLYPVIYICSTKCSYHA